MPVKTIVITGPESSGKTTLTARLAAHFYTHWVSEYARTYIDNLGRPYGERDLLEIAKGQEETENKIINISEGFVFLDTSLEVIKIWSEYKYGRCHPWIMDQLEKRKHNLYLLCQPDLPWQPDPQRENPNDRDELYKLYQQELTRLNANFFSVEGLKEKRFTKAVLYVESFFKIRTESSHDK